MKANLLQQNRVFIWLALATGLALLVPLIAMQFSDGVAWSAFDFAAMGALLFGAGSLFVLMARRLATNTTRLAVGLVLAVAVLWLWAELALGVFTDWGS